MNGTRHRRYRSLVQPSFVPNRAKWWMERWISTTVHALIDTFESDGRAELNVDFDAAIPVLTITGSFGVDVEDALDIRAAISRREPAMPAADTPLWIASSHRSSQHDGMSRRTT